MSHLSYVRQKNRDHGVPLSELSLEVTDHDRERAEDTVAELERLGLYRESGVAPGRPDDEAPPAVEAGSGDAPPSEDAPSERAPSEPPPGERRRREQVTDLWGNPLGSRRMRRKR